MHLILILLTLAGLDLTPTPVTTPRRAFRGAPGNSSLASFSPDGRLVAVGGGTSRVTIFQTRTGLLLRAYRHHEFPVTDLAFSPRQDTVASIDAAGNLRLWNPETLSTVARWKTPGPVRCLRFLPDGRRLALAGRQVVWIWEPGLDKPQIIDFAGEGAITTLAISHDGARLAAGFETGAVVVQEIAANATRKKQLLHKEPVTALLLTADEVLSAANGLELKRWKPASDELPQSVMFVQKIASVGAGPGPGQVVLGFETGKVSVWDLSQPQELYVSQSKGRARFVQWQAREGIVLAVYEGGGLAKTWKLP
jgi:WD40 repeat protein